MSLDYNLTKVQNRDKLCWVPDPIEPGKKMMSPVTQSLIFILGNTQFGSITEKNYLDVYKQIYVEERIFGERLLNPKDRSPLYLTLKDVKDHIGLWTNWGERTKTEYLKRYEVRLDRMISDEVKNLDREEVPA